MIRKVGGAVFGLVLVAILIVAFMKVTGVNSLSSLSTYLGEKSETMSRCIEGNDLETMWKCSTPGGPNGSSGNNGSNDSNGNSGDNGNSGAYSADIATLDSIPASPAQDVAYDRKEWKHWIGSPCDTREQVLKSAGQNVQTDSSCKAISGTWDDPYTAGQQNITVAKELDIDHVIPLGYANRHGGSEWSASKKQEFANDTSQLWAVSAKENRSKSDKGPSEYMPGDNQCQYAQVWVQTASKYGLTLTSEDKQVLKSTLEGCA